MGNFIKSKIHTFLQVSAIYGGYEEYSFTTQVKLCIMQTLRQHRQDGREDVGMGVRLCVHLLACGIGPQNNVNVAQNF